MEREVCRCSDEKREIGSSGFDGLEGGSKYQIAAHRASLATVLSMMDKGTVSGCPPMDLGKMFVVDVNWTSRVGSGIMD